uniref:DUF4158 domain-containing protein n=1 Tax=Streptomyces sp. NBC_00093 TaxID=2975649 RepID=A0AAU2AE78_9ACTN
MRLELRPDTVEHVAKQVGVPASELAFYDFTSRAAKRHRSELRDLTGWHECRVALPARYRLLHPVVGTPRVRRPTPHPHTAPPLSRGPKPTPKCR